MKYEIVYKLKEGGKLNLTDYASYFYINDGKIFLSRSLEQINIPYLNIKINESKFSEFRDNEILFTLSEIFPIDLKTIPKKPVNVDDIPIGDIAKNEDKPNQTLNEYIEELNLPENLSENLTESSKNLKEIINDENKDTYDSIMRTLDHNFIIRDFKIGEKEIRLVSINIPQIQKFEFSRLFGYSTKIRTLNILQEMNDIKSNIEKIKEIENKNMNKIPIETEDDSQYINRVKLIIEFITNNICKSKEYFIICIQEFMAEFSEIISQNPELHLKTNLNDRGIASILVTNKGFIEKFEIIHIENNVDEGEETIVNHFFDRFTPLFKFSGNKSSLYKITELNLETKSSANPIYLLNIHTEMYRNIMAINILNLAFKKLLNYRYIIVGDMNLQLNQSILPYFHDFFNEIYPNKYEIVPTPEIGYNIEYLDGSLPTYDVYFEKLFI